MSEGEERGIKNRVRQQGKKREKRTYKPAAHTEATDFTACVHRLIFTYYGVSRRKEHRRRRRIDVIDGRLDEAGEPKSQATK